MSLVNDGQLSIFALGSGGAFNKKLYQNNYLIIKGNTHILVDCGTRAPQALNELGLNVTAIDNLHITHSHADHIGGVEELILMDRYVAKKKPSIVISEEYQKLLWEHSLSGGSGYNERIGKKGLGFEDYFNVLRPTPLKNYPRQAWEIELGGIHLVIFRTMHFPDSANSWKDSIFSTGLIIDKRFLFSGDTRFDPGLITEAERAYSIEAIFHDVQFYPGGVHANITELATLPEETKQKMLLMHYPDNFEERLPQILDAGFAGTVLQHHYYDFE